MKPVFRYVVLDLTSNYALEFERDALYKVGEIIYRYDIGDKKTHAMRVVRVEGTAYNKSKEQLAREKESEVRVA